MGAYIPDGFYNLITWDQFNALSFADTVFEWRCIWYLRRITRTVKKEFHSPLLLTYFVCCKDLTWHFSFITLWTVKSIWPSLSSCLFLPIPHVDLWYFRNIHIHWLVLRTKCYVITIHQKIQMCLLASSFYFSTCDHCFIFALTSWSSACLLLTLFLSLLLSSSACCHICPRPLAFASLFSLHLFFLNVNHSALPLLSACSSAYILPFGFPTPFTPVISLTLLNIFS